MKLYISKATLRTIEKFGNASLTHISATPSDHMSVELDATPLASEASKPACAHRIVDARNEIVKSGYLCVDCGAVFAGIHAPAAPSVEQDARGAFEAWARKQPKHVIKDLQRYPDNHPDKSRAGQYGHCTTADAWGIWQAAHAASTSANVAQMKALVYDALSARVEKLGFKSIADAFDSINVANVAQYRNEALSALLVDHSHAASAKDVDAVLKARDAIYSMFANVAQGAEAMTEDISLVRELQKALFYWMPRIAGEDSPAGHKAAEHAYLLIGLDDNSSECYGDQARSSLGIVNRELERIGIACSDAGCPDEMEVADFIADLYARAQAAATVASTDDARECLADVVSHYRALYAGLAFQLNEATVSENSDDMTYWKHEIKALERMYAQAERALTAAQSASGDTK